MNELPPPVISYYSRKKSQLLEASRVLRRAALVVIKCRWFERFSLLMITINCIALGLADPCDTHCKKPMCRTFQYAEHFIFTFFASEMVLKMIALGLVGENAYLSDTWNIFDCFIVLVGALEYALANQEINFSAIRAIRVLRPLRAINRISSLRLLVTLLLDIMPMLGNVLIFCFFLFLIFGIIAVQLWTGLLRHRCFFPPLLAQSDNQPPSFMPAYYRPPNSEYVCTTAFGTLKCNQIPEFEQTMSMCNNLFSSNVSRLELCNAWVANYTECRPSGPNPARGALSFDNIGYAWIVIFQIISLEMWSEIMYAVQDSYSFWTWIYFVVLVLLGSYLAVNLCLVVIATQFSETKARERENMKKERLSRRRAERSISATSSAFSTGSLTSSSKDLYTQIRSLIAHVIRKALHKTFGIRLAGKKAAPSTFLVHCPECRHVAQIKVAYYDTDRLCAKCGCEMDVKSAVLQFSLRRRLGLSLSKNRAWMRQCLQNNVAILITMIAIILNAVIMALEHHGQPLELTKFIETMNLIFTFVFLAEMLLKLYAYGLDDYFAEAFNAFDAIIIIINVTELFSSDGGSGLAVLRLFRLLRIVKIIRFLPALQKQLLVMVATVDHVATFFFLLSFFLYIASLLGMSLFGCKFCEPIDSSSNNDNNNNAALLSSSIIMATDAIAASKGRCQLIVADWSNLNASLQTLNNYSTVITDGDNNNEILTMNGTNDDDVIKQSHPESLWRCSVTNFDSLWESLFTVLQIFTQDNWAPVMQDGMHYTSDWASIYFVILVTIGNYIIFNLLIAILVEAFSSMNEEDDHSILEIFGHESVNSVSRENSLLQLDDDDKAKQTARARLSDRSLFVFAKHNCLRRRLRRLLASKYYDKILLVVVLGSCALIVLERPSIQPDSFERHFITVATYTFSIVFVFEAAIKIIAYGLIFGQKTYLRSWWNVMDFMLAILAILDIILDLLSSRKHHDSNKNDTLGSTLHETLRILGLFRALRPLRIISRAPGLQVVIRTLMVSVKPIGNIVLICCFFFGIFSILGVQLFSGCFSRCIIPSKQFSIGNFTQIYNESYANWASTAIESVETRSQCEELGFHWYTERFNFDNLPNALIALFIFSTLDGWAAITTNGIACVGVDKQPIYNHNPWAYFYFISFLLVVCFFTLNMFVGVVVNNFQKVQKQVEARTRYKMQELQAKALFNRLSLKMTQLSTKASINKTLLMASAGLANSIGMRMQMPKLKNNAKDDEEEEEEEEGEENKQYWLAYPKWRLWIFVIFTHKYFEMTVIAATCLNVLVMAAEFYQMPATLHLIMTTIGYIFLVFVILEVVFKVIALGFRRYWRERWNQLDAGIAFISTVCVIFDEMDYLPINPAVVRATRVFRIVRAFKLLKSASGLRHLMHTIGQAIPHVLHLSLLFALLFFVYASLGVQLYGAFDCTYDVCLGLSRHANFHNMGIAMLTLFRILTGDSWNEILKDILWLTNDPSKCNSQTQGSNAIPCRVIHFVSPAYFISFVLLTQFVLINIVVAALLNQLNNPDGKRGPKTEEDEAVKAAEIEADAIARVEKIEEIIADQYPREIEALLRTSEGAAIPSFKIEEAISIISTEYVLQQPMSRPDTLPLHNISIISEDVDEQRNNVDNNNNDNDNFDFLQTQRSSSIIIAPRLSRTSVTPPSININDGPDLIPPNEMMMRSSTAIRPSPIHSSHSSDVVDNQLLKRVIVAVAEKHNLLTVGDSVGSTATAYVELRRAEFKNRQAYSSTSNCSQSPHHSSAVSSHSNQSFNSIFGVLSSPTT